MLKRAKMHSVVVGVLTVMLVASLLLAVVNLLAPVRKALAGPPEPEGYCDYFWDCWKKVGCDFYTQCPPSNPPCIGEARVKFLYYRYQRYAGACEACPTPCCWRHPSGGEMSDCDDDLGDCPAWCPGSP